MSVYNPSGAGNVHVDRVISGGSGKGTKMAKKVAKKSPVKITAPVKMADRKGMGFAAAAAAAAKSAGVPLKQGQAIVAAASRNASPSAKKANPNLKKVVKKAAPKPTKAMADTPMSARQRRTSTAAAVRASATKMLPSQSRIGC
jgi:type IV secretory pathway VirJ component